MAVKFTIDKLDDVEEWLRPHYVAEGDKFVLATQGEHPKVTEFRGNNIRLTNDLAKFDGVDLEEYTTLKAKAAAGELAEVLALKAELATKNVALADAQKRADALVIESTISDAFLKAGGTPKARGFVVGQAASMFTVENGALKGTKFSPSRPGEPMSVDEWMLLQTRENSFCFGPSGGGGADPKRGSASTGVKELRDPSPQDLGRHAADIAAGRVRVVYSS